jgi:hypothetical protein
MGVDADEEKEAVWHCATFGRLGLRRHTSLDMRDRTGMHDVTCNRNHTGKRSGCAKHAPPSMEGVWRPRRGRCFHFHSFIRCASWRKNCQEPAGACRNWSYKMRGGDSAGTNRHRRTTAKRRLSGKLIRTRLLLHVHRHLPWLALESQEGDVVRVGGHWVAGDNYCSRRHRRVAPICSSSAGPSGH